MNFCHSSLSLYSWYLNIFISKIHMYLYLYACLYLCSYFLYNYLYLMWILELSVILPLLWFLIFYSLISCTSYFILFLWYFCFVTRIHYFIYHISIYLIFILFIVSYFYLFYFIFNYFITDQTPLSFQLLSEMKDAKRSISDIKFSPDGSTLGVAARDNSIYLYSTAQQFKKRAVFSKHNAGINQFDFSMDGKSIQSCCR